MTEQPKTNNKLIIIIVGIVIAVVIIATTIFLLNRKPAEDKKDDTSNSKKTEVNGVEIDSKADLVDNFSKISSLSTLVTQVSNAGLTETLRGGPYTIFAPENMAFSKLPATTIQNLAKPENKKQLTDTLTYHLIAGTFKIEDLSDGQEITTINGAKLLVKKDSGTTTINGAKVINADLSTSNGVAHIIDTVLVPKNQNLKLTNVGGVELSSEKDFLQNLALAPTLTTVAAAVDAGGLTSTLKTEGPFTIFVPSNSAFSNLPAGTVENLLKAENRSQLISILTFHVIPGKLLVANLKDGQEITTISGAKLKVKIVNNVVTIIGAKSENIATIITPDVVQSNGVAHIIDTVLFPAAS